MPSVCVPNRNGRLLRAKDLGLTPTINTSLDANQSFPRLSRKLKCVNKVQLSKALLKPEGLDSISFSTQATNNSFRADHTSYLEEYYSQSYIQEDSILNPNPHKGVITFNITTSQVYAYSCLLHFYLSNLACAFRLS